MIFLLLRYVSGERLQPIFRQFVNLIKQYATYNLKQKPINTNAITRHNITAIFCDQ